MKECVLSSYVRFALFHRLYAPTRHIVEEKLKMFREKTVLLYAQVGILYTAPVKSL